MLSTKLKSLISDLEPLACNPILVSRDPLQGNQKNLFDQLKLAVESRIKFHKLTPNDYSQFINYSSSSYTKNLVHDFNGKSNLIIMCWGPGQASKWHSHDGSRCFVRVLKGDLLEERAPMPNCELAKSFQVSSSAIIRETENEVYFIDDQIGLHKVTNLSQDEGAITMHFYTPAYKKCRLFDVVTPSPNNCHTQSESSLAKSSKLIDVSFDNNNN